MKIGLCTVPPVEKEKSPLDIPLGLLSLAGMLEKEKLKVEIEIIDFFKLCKDKILKKDKYFCREAINFLLEKNFDIIGFSTMCLSYPLTLQIVDGCKNRDIIIILGGPEASLSDIETLKYFNSNNIYIVRGEGERTFLDLIKVFYSGNLHSLSEIKGITYKMNNKIIKNSPQELIKDLDELPFPSFHLYPYISEVEEVIIEIGRSCPYSCKYCSTSLHWGRKSRFKSPERVFSEIEYLKSNYGKSIFFFLHDCPTANKEYFIKLTSKIKELNIKFRCYARADHLTKEEINILKENGLNGIFYGIESGSSRMQSFIGKNLDLGKSYQILKSTSDAGIRFITSFIIGFPPEEEEDMELTFVLALKSALLGGVSRIYPLLPLAGTQFFNKYKKFLKFNRYIGDTIHLEMLNLQFIKKHRELFPAYYYFSNTKIPYSTIIYAHILMSALVHFFPLFLYLWKFYEKRKINDLLKMWIKYCKDNNITLTKVNIYQFNILPYFKEIFLFLKWFKTNQKLSFFSSQILKYELAKVKLILEKDKKCYKFVEVNMDLNYFFKNFHPDIEVHVKEFFKKKKNYIMLHMQENSIRPFLLNRFTYIFLKEYFNSKNLESTFKKLNIFNDSTKTQIINTLKAFFENERNISN
ncbi:MAG: radical SAM protein [candidate division WOR-3 bacterium]